jgi:hypothetical protein
VEKSISSSSVTSTEVKKKKNVTDKCKVKTISVFDKYMAQGHTSAHPVDTLSGKFTLRR